MISVSTMEATYCVVDRSGSMASCLMDTIGGFNLFLDNQPEGSIISTYLFDNYVTELNRCQTVEKATRLTRSNYRPSGGTALLDAIGTTLELASNCTADSISIVILTDGEENTSKEYTLEQINSKIEQCKKDGWNFIFLAANQDAIKSANMIGIPEGGAITFDTKCVQTAFRVASDALSRVRSGESQTVEFSQIERTASCPCPN